MNINSSLSLAGVITPLNILIAIGFLAFIVLLILISILIKKRQDFGLLTQGMNLALFLISLPRETEREKDKPISIEDNLKTAEQFYSSLSGIKGRKSGFFSSQAPFLVFEIAVHRIGEEIYFYLACPKNLAGLIEKQVLSFWPKAQVQPVEDYNIFNPTGISVASEAKLARTAILPIKNSQEFKTDPISSLTSVLTKLKKEGEGGAIQFLIKPSQSKIKKQGLKAAELMQKGMKIDTAISKAKKGLFGEIIETLFSGQQEKKDQDFKKPDLAPSQQQTISAISKKCSEPLFDANIRLLASAENEINAKNILSQLESAFEQFNSPVQNQIKFQNASGNALKKLFYYFSFRLFSQSKIMTLSSGELAGLFHFPSPGILTPNIKWLKAKQAPPPAYLPEEGIIIGKNIFRGEEKIVKMSDKDRGRHFYIIGQTGTGKSGLLSELVRQDIAAGKGVALIDPHGDLAESVLATIPAERAEDVIYFNPGDMERPLGLNMLEFDPKYPESKTFVVNELIEIFEKLYNLKAQGFGGPIFEQYMRNSILLIMEDPESGSTLVEISKVLSDANFRKYKLSKCKNIVVKNFWELEAEKAGGEAALANMVPYITSKMNVFVANDMVRPIISQQHSSFNFREIMDQGKILIVNLSKGKLGEVNSFLLGMIIVGKILMSAFSRADVPEENRRDFYLYIDEFHNVTTKTISSVLAEARKYHLNMIFGHQFLGQLDEDTKKAIFGNVGSMLAYRIGPDDAKYLTTIFEPTFDENDLVNFDNFNGALRLLINGETSKPFNIAGFAPKKGNLEIANLIKELSRVKYGRDRNLVESELIDRLEKKL